jgi:hypothetical protein
LEVVLAGTFVPRPGPILSVDGRARLAADLRVGFAVDGRRPFSSGAFVPRAPPLVFVSRVPLGRGLAGAGVGASGEISVAPVGTDVVPAIGDGASPAEMSFVPSRAQNLASAS